MYIRVYIRIYVYICIYALIYTRIYVSICVYMYVGLTFPRLARLSVWHVETDIRNLTIMNHKKNKTKTKQLGAKFASGAKCALRDKLTRRGTTSPIKVPIPGQSPGANALVALTLRPDYLYVLAPRDHFPRVRPRGHLRPVRDRPHNQTRHRMVETGRGKYLSWARLRRGLGLPPPPAGNGAHAPPSRLTSRAVMACTVKAGVTTV